MVTLNPAKRDTIFRAIADPTRRRILALLRENDLTVGDIAENFSTSRPAISKHVRILRSAGLIAIHQEGAARVCELNAKPLRAISDWVGDYAHFWKQSLRGLKRYVEVNP